jgi:hypothetical protein
MGQVPVGVLGDSAAQLALSRVEEGPVTVVSEHMVGADEVVDLGPGAPEEDATFLAEGSGSALQAALLVGATVPYGATRSRLGHKLEGY